MGKTRWLFPCFLAVTVFLSVAVLLLLPRNAFWITDCSSKYLTTVNLVETAYSDFSIDYPGEETDPSFESTPLPLPFSFIQKGRMYSFYPPLFSFLSAPLYAGLGFRGLFLLPLLGGIAVMLLVRKIAILCGLPPRESAFCALAAFWCTPFLFYVFCFWEHTIGIAFVLLSTFFLLRHLATRVGLHLLLSGGILGLGIGFREEFYLMAAALFASMLLEKKTRHLSALLFPLGLLVGLMPIWLFQRWAIGSALGFHASVAFGASKGWGDVDLLRFLQERWEVVTQLLGNISTNQAFTVFYALCFLVVAALLLLSSRRNSNKAGVFACRAGLCLTALSGLYLGFSGDSIKAWAAGNGLIMHGALLLPVLLLPLNAGNDFPSRALRLMRNSAFLFVGMICATAPLISAQGIHWGPRLMLPIFPLLIVPVFSVLSRKTQGMPHFERPRRHDRRQTIALAALLMASFFVQVYSLSVLARKLDGTVNLEAKIIELPEQIVVSDLWWFPLEMSSIFYEKTFFFVKNDKHYQKLLTKLKEQKIRTILYVTDGDRNEDTLFRTQSTMTLSNVAVYRLLI